MNQSILIAARYNVLTIMLLNKTILVKYQQMKELEPLFLPLWAYHHEERKAEYVYIHAILSILTCSSVSI